ncbi:MAG: hypothetical protein ACI8SZ_000990 [Colwellia sp.]|jgi:hypothetical protein
MGRYVLSLRVMTEGFYYKLNYPIINITATEFGISSPQTKVQAYGYGNLAHNQYQYR